MKGVSIDEWEAECIRRHLALENEIVEHPVVTEAIKVFGVDSNMVSPVVRLDLTVPINDEGSNG